MSRAAWGRAGAETCPRQPAGAGFARLCLAELRKVWGSRMFPLLLAVLAAANLLLLWMGTRPTDRQPPAEAWRAMGAELSGLSMEEKGVLLRARLEEAESLLRIGQYYQQLAWGGYATESYRAEHAGMFKQYEQEYHDKSYRAYTGSIAGDYRLFRQLADEYETVAGYPGFLQSVGAKARQLAGISIFQNDKTGYDLKNIEKTAGVYAGLAQIEINYTPQKGLYTALSYGFTDLVLLAGMLLLALLLVRQERDSGLLALVRCTPGGRLRTAAAKLMAFAVSLLAVLALLYGVNLFYCGTAFGLGPLWRSIQSVPALMRCTMQITVGEYLFRFLLAKWAGAFVMGLWVMLAALAARRAAFGWLAALALPLGMYGVRAAIPATSHWNVLKYANLASLLQTNELLGNYRNLFWFGSPVGLPLVEWATAVFYGALLAGGFCLCFARAALLPAPVRGLRLFARTRPRRTHATSVWREECRKLYLIGGAALFLAAFFAFGVWQGASSESYLDADEIYYAYYMRQIAGPYTAKSRDFLLAAREEFEPLLAAQRAVAEGRLPPEALAAYSALQQKYNVYQRVVSEKLGWLKEHSGAWLVYESGYERLFGQNGAAGVRADTQDALLAGLLVSLCCAGLFAMERRGGMVTVLRAAPLGRGRTVRAKLLAGGAAAVLIALGSCLPHLWQVLRDYGLPCLLAPARSIPAFAALPASLTISDLVLFWVLCRIAACLLMAGLTLALSDRLGNLLPALFFSAVGYCLPALLGLSGMNNGIQWLGAYPLFHAVALCGVQGYSANGTPYSLAWVPVLLCGSCLVITAALGWLLADRYEG